MREKIAAVIPVTDSSHALLPLHFSVDPGPGHDWKLNTLSPTMVPDPSDQLNLLNSYLDLVRVPLPEWLVDKPSPPPTPTPPPLPPNGGHIVNVYTTSHQRARRSTPRQIQNVVSKQIGNIGKKLKKNLGNIISNPSTIGSSNKTTVANKNVNKVAIRKDEVDSATTCQNDTEQKKIVSGAQSFILGAVILTDDNLLPYQDEMINNYLQVRQWAQY